MRTTATTLALLLLASLPQPAQAQSPEFDGPFVDVIEPQFSPPLRLIPPAPAPDVDGPRDYRMPPARFVPMAGWDDNNRSADPLAEMGVNGLSRTPSPLLNFQGLSNECSCSPPDTVGAAGLNHYVQMVNATRLAIFNKSTGAQIGGTISLKSLWTSGICSTTDDGDPIVVYDYLANRFVLAQFYSNGICVAVSQGSDPTGAYNLYQFPTPTFPDYYKIGAWTDAYYVSANENFYSALALDRAAMLAGTAATSIRFDGEENLLMPATVVGSTAPPAGTPGIFYTFKDNAFHGGVDRLEMFHFAADFATPASSSFTLVQSLPITSYTYTVCGFFVLGCIHQGGTAQRVDPVSEWPMWQLQYRNRGAAGEKLVANFTVDVGSDRAGIRWYELNKTGATTYAIAQEGSYAPDDGRHRWMGSIAMDRDGGIALGYSASSTTESPSLRYATRLASDPAGTLQSEAILQAGGGSQTSSNRWGDYSAMVVDPSDDCTFWFTSEYYTANSGNNWTTRIGKFKMPECGATASVSIGDVSVNEGSGGNFNVNFTVTRSNTLTSFTVPWSTANGSAVAPGDYTSASGTLTFPAGAGQPLTQTVSVQVIDDNVVEGSETFLVNLGVVSDTTGTTTVSDGQGEATLNDSDSASVQFSAATYGQSEATTPLVVTVNLSNPVQSGVAATLNASPGSASAADFTPIVNGVVNFPPNSVAAQTVNVVIANDALDEDDETIALALTSPVATGSVVLGGNANATATIVDDDPLPLLSISSPSLLEGNSGNAPMTFVASLSAVSGRDVSFQRATADGSATTADNDYVGLAAAPLSIPAGQQTLNIPVSINGDPVFEGNESFSLNLSAITNANPGTLVGTGTILDDDQQATNTTILGHAPDPSVTGQGYLVSVRVAGASSSPAGTVTIRDGAPGSPSCGPVALVADAAPSSLASCTLISTSAGAKTLTADYAPASATFAASSGSAAHQVNPAATTISVSGPVRSRIDTPTAFSFALDVSAPGAGSPAGTVTLSSGAVNCQVTVPTATPSCSLAFATLGPRTVSAAFVPSNGDFLASSSSGAGNAQTLVYALADLAVTKSDGLPTYAPGDLIVYTVTVRNLGADSAVGVRVQDNVPAGLGDVVWTCDSSGGASCPLPGGNGNLDALLASLPAGGLLNYTFFGNVAGAPPTIVNSVQLLLPADATIEDPLLSNNQAIDTNLLDLLLRNGFESALIDAAKGSVRVPGPAELRSLDDHARIALALTDVAGEAVRVYARIHDGQLQFALALRAAGSGALRLSAWRSFDREPVLNWTALPVADGWRLQTAELR